MRKWIAGVLALALIGAAGCGGGSDAARAQAINLGVKQESYSVAQSTCFVDQMNAAGVSSGRLVWLYQHPAAALNGDALVKAFAAAGACNIDVQQ